MRTSISKIVILLSSILLFLACSTSEERRFNAIKSILSDTIEKTDAIEVINESYDSIYSTQRNIKHIKKIQEIILLRDSTLQMLTNFKAKYADKNNRVWLKNVSNELKDSYEEILKAEARMVSLINDLATSCNSDTMMGKPQQSIVLKYKANGTIKYGLFIFNKNTEISHYKIFSEEEYASINNFITIAQKDAIEFIPYFENMGIEIVSVDETPKVVIPQFSLMKREREDYNEYTPRTRFHIKTPELYTESELNIIADSLLKKEQRESGISEIWVNYYLPNKKIHHSNSYGLSIRLKTERSSTIFQKEEKRYGYNPPKARDLSNENIRTKQLWGAFDRGQMAGYEAGYKDGKKRKRVYYSFDSYYPTNDEWIEQSYKQGYEVGYLNGFDDAGGTR